MADRQKCTTHRNRDSTGVCVNCGKPYCAACLERIGRGYVCFTCLKGVARDTLKKQSYRPLTLGIIVAAGLFLAMAAAAIVSIGGTLISAIGALGANQVGGGLTAFFQKNPAALRDIAIGIGKALVFFYEAYLLSMNRSFSFWLGLVVAAVVLYFGITAPYTALSNVGLLFELMIPFVAFALIIVSYRELTA